MLVLQGYVGLLLSYLVFWIFRFIFSFSIVSAVIFLNFSGVKSLAMLLESLLCISISS